MSANVHLKTVNGEPFLFTHMVRVIFTGFHQSLQSTRNFSEFLKFLFDLTE
jgi:hypothetical protein